MAKLLDARTSQNASFNNSINIPILSTSTPQLVGQIGLLNAGATGIVRTQLSGTVTIQLPLLPAVTTVTIRVVRGTLASDPAVYSAATSLSTAILGPQTITFVGADYQPPITGNQIVYTMFVSVNVLGTFRVGPENFNGILVSD